MYTVYCHWYSTNSHFLRLYWTYFTVHVRQGGSYTSTGNWRHIWSLTKKIPKSHASIFNIGTIMRAQGRINSQVAHISKKRKGKSGHKSHPNCDQVKRDWDNERDPNSCGWYFIFSLSLLSPFFSPQASRSLQYRIKRLVWLLLTLLLLLLMFLLLLFALVAVVLQ